MVSELRGVRRGEDKALERALNIGCAASVLDVEGAWQFLRQSNSKFVDDDARLSRHSHVEPRRQHVRNAGCSRRA
jgi:hypothetical protein